MGIMPGGDALPAVLKVTVFVLLSCCAVLISLSELEEQSTHRKGP